MKSKLSLAEARRFILHSQRLSSAKHRTTALDTTLSMIEHLGYVQIDTISVIQRAHHHTLWSRNTHYKTAHLDSLVEDKKVFEYWSHAASYLPMSEYRYTLPQKQAILKGEQKFWYDKDEKLMNSVLERILKEGPLMAKDFEYAKKRTQAWSGKPEKQALEYLFMQGDLMISSRSHFHKVYDLRDRVLPKEVDCTIPSSQEHIRFLIRKYLEVNAIGKASEITYLLKNKKKIVSETLKEMHENKELIELTVDEHTYYGLPELFEIKQSALDLSRVKILSPFDNLLIQRKRMQALFDFDYKLECYVPKAKREYGYFSLPILWNEKLVARMDCKADKKASILHIYTIVLEASISELELFSQALYKELLLFLAFNHCKSFVLHSSRPTGFKELFSRCI